MSVSETTVDSRMVPNLTYIRDYCKEHQCTTKELLKDPEVDQSLKEWMYAKSTSIRKGSLSPEELDLCKEYGVDFGLHLYSWDDWCGLLKDYLAANNRDQVPDYYRIDKTYYLAAWAKRQIRLYKFLTPEQQEKLRDTGLKLREQRPVGRVNFVKCNGVQYRSVKEFAEKNNLSYTRTQQKIKNGKTLEDILAERNKLVFSGIQVTYNGQKYDSVRDFSEAMGMPYSYAVYHLRHFSPEDTVKHWKNDYPQNKRPGTAVTYKGKTYASIKDFANDLNLNYAIVVAELRKEKTPEEIVEYLSRERKRTYVGKQITYDGQTFNTLKDFCSFYGLSYSPTSTRLTHGWTLDEVINPSLHKGTPKITKKQSLDEWLKIQETSGNAKKLYEAAMVYLEYEDYADPDKALELLLKGYDYIFSKSVLARLYYDGTFVMKDIPAAIRCFEDFVREAKLYPTRFTPDYHSGIPRTVHAQLLNAYYQDASGANAENSLKKLQDLAEMDDLTAEQYLLKYYTVSKDADKRLAEKYREMISNHKPDPEPAKIKKSRSK